MNDPEHLKLRLARLKPAAEFEEKGEGLVFLFAKRGTGKYSAGLVSHQLVPGDILLFNRAASFKLAAFDSTGEFLYWSFSVCFENLLPLFSADEISVLHELTEGFKSGKVYAGDTPLVAECQRLLETVPPQFDLNHRGQLIRIAATILSAEFNDRRTRRGNGRHADDLLTRAFDKLSASEIIGLSVKELAGRFNCSRRHLNRLFHLHFGVSVAALRMEMRLLKAISLLRDGDAKVINIAEQCGFNHLGLFNTCFKKRFGTSPGQWRKASLDPTETKPAECQNKSVCPLNFSGLCPMNGRQEFTSPAILQACAQKVRDETPGAKAGKLRDVSYRPRPLRPPNLSADHDHEGFGA